jgi:hypothetical protein
VAPFPVSDNGSPLRYAFLGGFDAPRPQLADIDADGDLDLFVQEHPGAVIFFRNQGTTAEPDFVFVTDRYERLDVGQWAVLADLDGDLDLDLLAERPFGLIRVYRNEGSPSVATFRETVDTLRTNTGELITADATIPVVADVDCDGRIDLMLGRDAGTISRFEWISQEPDGDPVFAFVENRYQGIEVVGGVGKRGGSTLHGASSVTFSDVDHDGDPDLLWGDFFEPNVILFRNEGSCSSPAFNRETDFAMRSGSNPVNTSGYNAPRVADIDDDGKLDLLVGVLGGAFVSSTSSVENLYHLEDEAGYFDLVTSRFLPVFDVGSEAAPVFVDLDGVGYPDLIVGNMISPADPTRASISVIRGDGSTLNRVDEDAVSFQGFSAVPAATDVGCDGDPDLFVGGFDGRIASFIAMQSAGQIAWTLDDPDFAQIDVGSNSAPAWADIDDDGDDDLFVGEAGGSINFFRNVGTACQPVLTLESDLYAGVDVGTMSRPAFSDYDSDGDPDLFIGSDDGIVYFWRNEGSSSEARFVEGEAIETPARGVVTPALADMDADGDPDLVVGSPSGGLLYYRNDRIVSGVEYGRGEVPASLAVGPVYPNPASTGLAIDVILQRPQVLRVQTLDVLGRIVKDRDLGMTEPGRRTVRLVLGDQAPGLYIIRINGDVHRAIRRFILAR